MFGIDRRSPAAALAGGLVALVALVGCEGEPSVASRSAAAFREAQDKGETFEGAEHSHGHGAMTPGSGHTAPEAPAAAPPEEASLGHDHGEAGAPSVESQHVHGAHPGGAPAQGAPGAAAAAHSTMGHGSSESGAQAGRHATPGRSGSSGHEAGSPGHPGGHAGMDHERSPAATSETADHAGHDVMPPRTPPAGNPPASGGHAGHAPSPGDMAPNVAVAVPATVSPGQPAATLRPDALDAPAATSVVDAQRSAEMAEEMRGGSHGGHGSHGGGTYRQIDAGRGPGAYQGSEEQAPGAEPHHHDPATPPPSGEEGEHSHEPPGGGESAGGAVLEPATVLGERRQE